MGDRSRFGALSLGLTHIRRQLSSQPAIVFTLFVAVLVSGVLLASTSRVLEEVSSEDLAATVSEPHSANRNIAIERTGRTAPGTEDEPLVRVRQFGEQFADREMPESVRAVISDSYSIFQSPQFRVTPMIGEDPPHPFPTFLRLAYQDRIEDEMTLVDGRLPGPGEPIPHLLGSACPDGDAELWLELLELLTESEEPLLDAEGNAIDCVLGEISHYEVAVSASTAEAMGLEIGRTMLLSPDTTDALYFGLALDELQYNLAVSISGIVEFSDPDLEYWYGDTDLHRPRIQENADLRIIFATGVIDPHVYRDLFRDIGFASFRYIYRQFVSPTLIQDADLDVLVSDLREFQSLFTTVVAQPTRPRVVTQLSDLLEDHVDQRAETITVMSTTVASLFIVAVAVILQLAVLMTSRQRASLVYARNRGASRPQMGLSRIYEGIILVVPAAVLGYLIPDLAFEGTDDLLPYRITVALAAASVTMALVASWRLNTSSLGQLQREPATGRATTSRTIVFQVLVITVAMGSIILLRRRGSIQDAGTNASFDWLLATAPALLSISVAIVTTWIFPLVIRTLSWGAAQLRGLVGFIGFRRLLNRASGIPMSLAVILICVSAAVLASIAGQSVRRGQEVSSFQAVGADYVIKASATHANLPAALDIAGVSSIEESAFATTYARARLTRDTLDLPTEVMAIDAAAYRDVVAGTEGDAALPVSLTELPRPGTGSEDLPMPAIVADDWSSGFQPRVGERYVIDLGRLRPVIEIVELRPRFPDLPADRPFVVVNRQALSEFSELPVAPTALYLRAPEAAGIGLIETVADQTGGAEVISRYDVISDFRSDPFVNWVERGFTTVFVFAGLLGIVSALSALAVASSQRRIDFSFLKTVGLSNRQSTFLTIAEQVPVVLTATVFGTLAGVGIALFLDPALEYDAFTGNLVPTAVTVDWLSIAVLAAGVFVALTVAIVIFVLTTRSQDIGQALRVGDE